MHSAFLRKMVSLARIAGTAGGHHVGPIVVATAGQRNQMIPGQTLPMPEVGLAPMAVLTAIAISSKQECVGDLATEAAGNMDELDETDYCRFGKNESFASNDVSVVRFDDLGLPLDHQAEGTPHRDHGQWFKGGVQRQTPHADFSNVVKTEA
jgi:hypothetical protein